MADGSEASVPQRWDAIAAHGRTATAFRALGDDLAAWMPEADVLVAFAPVHGAAVAAGEPIAPLDRLVAVAEAFVAAQAARGRRASFFATEGRLAHAPRLTRRLIGEQPVWNPQRWREELRAHRSLREQVRRARAKRVVITALTADAMLSPAFGTALARLRARWHATRSMPPMRFLVTQALAEGAAHRRTFVARQGDALVGVLSLAPVPARAGWVFEHLLRDPDAPNGTAEMLVDHAMGVLADEGVTWATLGLAPLHGPIDRTLARIRDWSRPLFNFAGLSAFKRKLHPGHWEPIYLAWPIGDSGWRALLDGLRAFAGGSLLRFGVRTVLRGPWPILRVLTWLLAPWAVLLALAPVSPWFPSRTVQSAWVVFDLALLLALQAMIEGERRHGMAARRAQARLATGVAIAVTMDAMLTAVEAVVYRAPWHAGAAGRLLTVIACTGPALASLLLWGAAQRTRVLAAGTAAYR